MGRSLSWRPRGDAPHPLAELYRQGANRAAGWRRLQRRDELGLSGVAPKQMAPAEQFAYALEFAMLTGLSLSTGLPHGAINRAWGLSDRYHVTSVARMYDNGGGARQQRSDAGRNIFNDHDFAAARITALGEYRRALTASGSSAASIGLGAGDLRAQFDDLPSEEQLGYEYEAEKRRARIPHVRQEAIEILQRTSGSVSWAALASNVGDYCDPTTLARYFQSFEDFEYVTVGTVPYLSPAHVQQRMLWARSFWCFWHSARLNGLRVILVHMDEKWFWACVARRNAKRISCLGITPKDFKVHHKSHIDKVMIIAASGIVVEDGNIENGGVGVKVGFVRAGKMVEAGQDAFRRAYNKDFTSWTMTGEQTRWKGQMYFKSMEVTGSAEGTKKQPKFPLQAVFRDTFIPRMEELCREVSLCLFPLFVGAFPGCVTLTYAKLAAMALHTRQHNAIIRWQCDGAGPHRDDVLNAWLMEEFAARNWHFKFQPPNSPLTNTKDAQIFPALSKRVSQRQSLASGNHVLTMDEIWSHAEAAWNDLPEADIARSFMSHHQIVNAILEHEGSNSFVRERGGLHFNVRKHYVQTADGMELLEENEMAVESTALRLTPPPYEPTTLAAEWLGQLGELEKASIEYGKQQKAAAAATERAAGMIGAAAAVAAGRDRRRPSRFD